MKKFSLYIILLFLPLLCSSCTLLPVEEEPLPPPVIKEYESTVFKTITVQKGTLCQYIDKITKKVPAYEETLSFTISEVLYAKIHVNLGDSVKAGDILAELEKTDLEKELEEARYSYKQLTMEIRQAEETYLINKKYNKENEYTYEKNMENMNARLRLLELDIESVQKQIEARTLIAPIDGTITFLKQIEEGDRSEAMVKFVTVTDLSVSMYVLEETEGMDFKLGETVSMKKVTFFDDFFDAVVVNPDNYVQNPIEGAIYFLKSSSEGIAGDEIVYVRYIKEVKDDVLYLPRRAVNTSDGKQFVYILNDNVREMLNIEIGMEDSSGLVEIVSGLEEGDSVVIS